MQDKTGSLASKLLIVAILATALALAAFSWWFRFAATHRAAQFWGPENVRMIRDAPRVELARLVGQHPDAGAAGDSPSLAAGPAPAARPRDVSGAPGMTHLRNALLEDRSFRWEETADSQVRDAHYALRFSGDSPDDSLQILFSDSCRQLHRADGRSVSTAPIAEGLRTVLEEMLAPERPR